MNYNLTQFQGRYVPRKNQTLPTKLTSASYDMGSQLCTVLAKTLLPKIRDIKKDSLKIIKAHKKMDPQMLMFINHCATLIQSRFRGYQQRKYYKMFRPVMRRFKELLGAMVSGWKMRRIMKLKPIVKKYAKIKQEEERKNFREARIMKRDLIDDVKSLLAKGKWLEFVDKKDIKQPKCKIILRSALRGIEQRPNNQKTKANSINKSTNNKNERINQSSKRENEPNQQITDFNQDLEKEIPIKATGFYKIPDQINEGSLIQQKQPKVKAKRMVQKNKLIKKISGNNTNIKQDPQSKEDKDIPTKKDQKQTQKSLPNQEIVSKNHEKSIMSIHLPVEQVEARIDQFVSAGSRTIKLDSRRIQQAQSIQTSSMGQTQKIKRIGKGIKVTLSLHSQQDLAQPQKKNQPSRHQPNSQPAKVQTPVNIKQKDELDQILSVYNSAYTNKKKQIDQRFKQMKSLKKFTS